jgi:DDE superfamily endonuclease
LQDIFIPQTSMELADNQYRLLLLDGHRSHTTIDFMWECYTSKIIPFYLIAHASHVLQPLDLTVFSSLKRTYRAAVAFDSNLDDTTPVKKQRFLEYYQNARNSALSNINIRSGFQTAGIVPWNPRKALSSPFIIHRDDDDDIVKPTSPVRPVLQQTVPYTPTNRRELYQAVSTIEPSTVIDRSVRQLFTKTGRAFDRLHFDLATSQRQLASHKRQLDDYRSKSKRREPVNPNKLFNNLEDIQAAVERANAQIATTRGATTRLQAIAPTVRATQANIDPFLAIVEQLQSIQSL